MNCLVETVDFYDISKSFTPQDTGIISRVLLAEGGIIKLTRTDHHLLCPRSTRARGRSSGGQASPLELHAHAQHFCTKGLGSEHLHNGGDSQMNLSLVENQRSFGFTGA